MRAIIQRVTEASVSVGGRVVGEIGQGLVVLVGVKQADTEADAKRLAEKSALLRIFADEASKFNLSAVDVSAEILVVSQFTVYADTRKGRRPSFVDAAAPDVAEPLIERYAEFLRNFGLKVATGWFGAHMLVKILNDGPVTVILDT
ncbi:MAG: D-tyrosyl-tRNA(Tyr) deacylase [Chloroflexi bacterium]|nr:D-tyrosyl-tRNA(Tyr) deacylase [Chloroflexota bacterium]